MVTTVAELIDNLTTDPWRSREGFSEEINHAHAQLFGASHSEAEVTQFINDWIGKFQPCLFGRIGARLNLISYCILSESDLANPDSFIQDKIQEARLEWLRAGLNGDKSAFVIIALSQAIAEAVPDVIVQGLARRLCSLYLLKDVGMDHIYL